MKALSQAALRVLDTQLAVDGPRVRITGQLDRKLYTEVNAALEALGGTWKRGAKAHVFETDPAEAIDAVLAAGGFVDRKRDLNQFYTPASLATRVVMMAEVAGCRVLEPSAGRGALAKECITQGASIVHCVEIDNLNADFLREDDDLIVHAGDFLTFESRVPYERVVMNPPFAREQDIVHVTHAFEHHLARSGRLVAIMGAGVTFRETKRAKAFRELVAACGELEELPRHSFRESGTDVNAVIVTLVKR